MSVADRISELYLKNELSDVVFIFPDYGDEKVIGHRIILATASSVFKDLLYSCKPGPEIVNIEGFAPKIFKLVLRYIYQDEIPWKKECLISIMDLYNCAKHYKIDGLTKKCRSVILNYLEGRFNYIEIFRHSRKISLMFVYNSVLGKIAQNFSCVSREPSFLSLTSEELAIVFEKEDKFEIDELTLFNALDKCANAHCKANGKLSNGEEKRKELGNIIFKVRIPLIPLQQFADEVVPTGILTPSEQLAMFKYHSKVVTFISDVSGFKITKRDKDVARFSDCN